MNGIVVHLPIRKTQWKQKSTAPSITPRNYFYFLHSAGAQTHRPDKLVGMFFLFFVFSRIAFFFSFIPSPPEFPFSYICIHPMPQHSRKKSHSYINKYISIKNCWKHAKGVGSRVPRRPASPFEENTLSVMYPYPLDYSYTHTHTHQYPVVSSDLVCGYASGGGRGSSVKFPPWPLTPLCFVLFHDRSAFSSLHTRSRKEKKKKTIT